MNPETTIEETTEDPTTASQYVAAASLIGIGIAATVATYRTVRFIRRFRQARAAAVLLACDEAIASVE